MSIAIQVECTLWDSNTSDPTLKLENLRGASSPAGATTPPAQPGLGSYFRVKANGPLGVFDLNRWIANTPELALEEGRAIDDWQVVQAVFAPDPAAGGGTSAELFCVSRGPAPTIGTPPEWQVGFDSRKFWEAGAFITSVHTCWPLWTGTALVMRSDFAPSRPGLNAVIFNLVKIRDITDPCRTPSPALPLIPPPA